MNRDLTFDRARGLAILIMVFANTVPVLENPEQVSFGIRALFSLAAPIFIIVSALLLSLHAHKRSFGYYLSRGAFIFFMGACLDAFVYQIVPFQSFDVLYLIGFSMPAIYLVQRFRSLTIGGIILGILLGSNILYQIFGYQSVPATIDLDGTNLIEEGYYPVLWRHWLIDGWFPIMPWLGVAFSGVLFARIRLSSHRFAFYTSTPFISFMIALILCGIFFNMAHSSPYYVRDGFIELFYPATTGVCLIAIGSTGLILSLFDVLPSSKIFKLIEMIGARPLPMYIVHLALISYLIEPFCSPTQSTQVYVWACLAIIALLYLTAFCINKLRRIYPQMPQLLQWTIGK